MPRARAASALLPPAAARARTQQLALASLPVGTLAKDGRGQPRRGGDDARRRRHRQKRGPVVRRGAKRLLQPVFAVVLGRLRVGSARPIREGRQVERIGVQFVGEFLHSHHGFLRHHDGSLQDVFELPNVTRPGVGLEPGHGVVVDAGDVLVHLLVVDAEKMQGQLRDVLGPLAQGRHHDVQHVQSEEQGPRGIAPAASAPSRS